MDNKQEFKNFLKALKGAIILFAGICAGIGSLNFASASSQSFFTFTGIVSIVISVVTGVMIFVELWNATEKSSGQAGGGSVMEQPEKTQKKQQSMLK